MLMEDHLQLFPSRLRHYLHVKQKQNKGEWRGIHWSQSSINSVLAFRETTLITRLLLYDVVFFSSTTTSFSSSFDGHPVSLAWSRGIWGGIMSSRNEAEFKKWKKWRTKQQQKMNKIVTRTLRWTSTTVGEGRRLECGLYIKRETKEEKCSQQTNQ